MQGSGAFFALRFFCVCAGVGGMLWSCTPRARVFHAQDASFDEARVRGTLVVGVGRDLAPLVDAATFSAFSLPSSVVPPPARCSLLLQEARGYDVELLAQVARRLHMDVQVKVVHWDEKERALHAGVIDCIADGFTYTADHARRFALTQPYVRDVRVFAVLRQAPYATVADLHGKRLGVHAVTDVEENDAYHALFGQVKTYAHYVQALTALSRAEVDVVALNLVTLCAVTPHLRRLYRILDEPIDTCEYVFAFRADARALRDMVVRTLSQLQREGFVSALSKRWFGSDMSIIDR